MITLVSALATAAIGADAAGPAISIDQRAHDAGEVVRGTTVEAVFEVSNLGDEALDIAVKPTCGCTVVEHDARIAAHSTGRIVAHIDTAELAGPTTKALLVSSNDRRLPALRLTVRADVRPAG
jgi:hypothetical protein